MFLHQEGVREQKVNKDLDIANISWRLHYNFNLITIHFAFRSNLTELRRDREERKGEKKRSRRKEEIKEKLGREVEEGEERGSGERLKRERKGEIKKKLKIDRERG